MEKPRIRIMVVDDHAMIRKGLTATLETEPDMEIVGSAATGKQAVEKFRELQPDVTIMDLTLTPDMSGVEAIRAICKEFPGARVVVFSAAKGDEDIFRAFQAGAATYLLKDTLGDDLVPVIREVFAGGGPIPPYVARQLADRLRLASLTPREMDVLNLVAKGYRNKEISAELHISDLTTHGHLKNILAKLNVHDRTEAVMVAARRGIIHLD